MYKNFQIKFLKTSGKCHIVNPVLTPYRRQINVIKFRFQAFVFYMIKSMAITNRKNVVG